MIIAFCFLCDIISLCFNQHFDICLNPLWHFICQGDFLFLDRYIFIPDLIFQKTFNPFFNQFKYKQNKKATNRINTKFVAYDSNENRTRDSTLRGSRLNRLTMEPDLYSRWSVATTSIYYTYYFCNVKNFLN